jgi:hypothetical protein
MGHKGSETAFGSQIIQFFTTYLQQKKQINQSSTIGLS